MSAELHSSGSSTLGYFNTLRSQVLFVHAYQLESGQELNFRFVKYMELSLRRLAVVHWLHSRKIQLCFLPHRLYITEIVFWFVTSNGNQTFSITEPPGRLIEDAALNQEQLLHCTKAIQMIYRLFLVTAMYCQASSSQFFFNHLTSIIFLCASWLGKKPRYMQQVAIHQKQHIYYLNFLKETLKQQALSAYYPNVYTGFQLFSWVNQYSHL